MSAQEPLYVREKAIQLLVERKGGMVIRRNKGAHLMEDQALELERKAVEDDEQGEQSEHQAKPCLVGNHLKPFLFFFFP